MEAIRIKSGGIHVHGAVVAAIIVFGSVTLLLDNDYYIKIKPTQLIGKYGHIEFKLNYWGPTGNNRDIKVEIEKFKGVPPNQA